MEDCHAKDCDEPGDQGNKHDPHNDGHAAAADSGKDLTADDAVDGAVADHEDDVQDTCDFRGPVSHEVSSNHLHDMSVFYQPAHPSTQSSSYDLYKNEHTMVLFPLWAPQILI